MPQRDNLTRHSSLSRLRPRLPGSPLLLVNHLFILPQSPRASDSPAPPQPFSCSTSARRRATRSKAQRSTGIPSRSMSCSRRRPPARSAAARPATPAQERASCHRSMLPPRHRADGVGTAADCGTCTTAHSTAGCRSGWRAKLLQTTSPISWSFSSADEGSQWSLAMTAPGRSWMASR